MPKNARTARASATRAARARPGSASPKALGATEVDVQLTGLIASYARRERILPLVMRRVCLV
jgi:hypothetical protein